MTQQVMTLCMDVSEVNRFSPTRSIWFSSNESVFLRHLLPGVFCQWHICGRSAMELMKCRFSKEHDRLPVGPLIDSVKEIQVCQPPPALRNLSLKPPSF